MNAPPSIALARMALTLAGVRVWKIDMPFAEGARPIDRDCVSPAANRMSLEYYRIIDRITRGETP